MLVSVLLITVYFRHTLTFAPRLKAYGPAVGTEGKVLVKVEQKKGAQAPFLMIIDF